MRAGLFPGQGIDPTLLIESLDPDHPKVLRSSEVLGFDLRRRIEQISRRTSRTLPTTLAQPGTLVAGVIAHEQAVERGERFDYLLGHSLGEYTALVGAGSIPFEQGVTLISARAETMHRAARLSSGGMIAVLGLGPEDVARIAGANDLAIANENTPRQTVLSGATGALSHAARDVSAVGGRSILLKVEGAFHSAAMRPAAADLDSALMSTIIRSPSVPVISNVTASPYRSPGEIRKLLVAQLTGCVRFRESLLYLREQGVTEFIDLGPGDVVARLAKATVTPVTEGARA